MGIGGIIVVVIVMLLFGGDLGSILGGLSGGGGAGQFAPQTPNNAGQQRPAATTQASDELAQFTAVVLAETEDVWHKLFRAGGSQYEEPTLVLFWNSVRSACGSAQSAMGPFYCPGDRKVYIDLSFFDELRNRFGAPGDFAQAYVIAHEVGHHVQTLLGSSSQVRQAQSQASKTESNQMQVMMELQADCFAGIWAHHAQETAQILEPGDIDEALTAAAAIGDDRLQQQAQGYVVPDAFTHGTSEQRQQWFRTGYQSGQVNACNTFEAGNR